MAQKTLTISEKAYRSLARHKREGESFTHLILRLVPRHTAEDLREYFEQLGPQPELAEAIETVYRERRRARLREVEVE
ncbi:MAG: antitoxin VapB family protein [Thermoplasmata archaeon]